MTRKIILVLYIILISTIIYGQKLDLYNNVHEEIITQGPGILFIDSPKTDYVSLSVFIKLTEAPPGLAHLAEHLVFASNPKLNSGDFDKICEKYGCTCDAYTNYDYSVYKLVVKVEFLPIILEYLSYVLLYHEVKDSELYLEKSIIKDEYWGRRSVPFNNIRYMLQKGLYGSNYYGYPIEGDNISEYTALDLNSFYDNNYISKNIRIVIFGSVDREEIKDIIKKYYVEPEKMSFNIPIDVVPKQKSLYINDIKGYFGIMFSLAGTYSIEEAIVCDVLSQLVDNLSSKEIQKKYNSKSVYIHNSGKWASPFTIIYQTEDIDFVKDCIFSAIKRVKAGEFDEYDIMDAKGVIISDYLGKNSNITSVTYNIGFYYVLYGFNVAVSYDRMISSVSKDDIINMANKYLNVYSSLICEKK